jgi:hypothetical protein
MGETDLKGKSGEPGVFELPLRREYRIQCLVMTRVGEIPVRGVKVKLDATDLGASDAEGKVPSSGKRSDPAFTITAEYGNTTEHLKNEIAEIKVISINLHKSTFAAQVSYAINKIQDVAGKGDIDFRDTASFSNAGEEVLLKKAGDGIYDFRVTFKLATISIQVPYINQNSSNDTVTTIPGKDPEPASHSHEVLPKTNGGILCFPTSVTMLLNYWGVSKTRAQVVQENYRRWAHDGFPGRADKASSTAKSATAPVDPPLGKLWLDTSTVDAAYGYSMKKATNIFGWEVVSGFAGLPDYTGKEPPPSPSPGKVWKDTSSDPAVFKKAKRKWTDAKDADWSYEEKTIEALKPAGTEVLRKFEDNVEIGNLPEDIMKEPYLGHIHERLAKGYPTVVSTTATEGHIMIIRGCVVDRNKNVKWLIANDPYGNLASPGSIYESISLSDGVGKEGTNAKDDVIQVQEVLKAAGKYDGAINGVCSGDDKDPLVKAIKNFQKQKMGKPHPDGKVEPGGNTEKKLAELDFSSYRGNEREANVEGTVGEKTMKGKHVYYNQKTRGKDKKLTLKGLWRGGLALKKDPEYKKSEIAGKLTPGA